MHSSTNFHEEGGLGENSSPYSNKIDLLTGSKVFDSSVLPGFSKQDWESMIQPSEDVLSKLQ